jgi:hypothetical protein
MTAIDKPGSLDEGIRRFGGTAGTHAYAKKGAWVYLGGCLLFQTLFCNGRTNVTMAREKECEIRGSEE